MTNGISSLDIIAQFLLLRTKKIAKKSNLLLKFSAVFVKMIDWTGEFLIYLGKGLGNGNETMSRVDSSR